MEQQTPIPPPQIPKSRMKSRKSQNASLIWGGGGRGLGFPFILSKIVAKALTCAAKTVGLQSWTKQMENLDPLPPPPNQGWENGAFCPSRGFILDLGGWGFAVPFYFVQDCSPRDNCGTVVEQK